MQYYIILPKYGDNLHNYYIEEGKQISRVSSLDLGMRLLQILEQIHLSGYVYNDLKLENILVTLSSELTKYQETQNLFPGESCFHQAKIVLIDFGFASQYISPDTGEHEDCFDVQFFQGNMLFGSANQLKFKNTSRKDDLISLLYLMIFLLNEGKIPDLIHSKKTSQLAKVKDTANQKMKHTPQSLCLGENESLVPFAKLIFKLEYKEDPDYFGMYQILEKLKKEASANEKL